LANIHRFVEIDKRRPCVVIDAEREGKIEKNRGKYANGKKLESHDGRSEEPLGEIDSWNFDDCADCWMSFS
jgi:hypothetical protein